MAVTYGETQTKDTDGKKFQGVLTDTGSATNEFYAVKGVNKATQNSETVADMSVAVTTASGAGAAIGATGDAAITTDTTGTVSGKLRGIVAWFARLGGVDGSAFTSGSSYVWAGLGGVYQSTVTTLAAEKTGLARLTSRRAVVTAGDAVDTYGSSGSVDYVGDMTVSTTALHSGYVAPTLAFFDGSDVGFGAGTRWIRVPMTAWRDCAFVIQNTLGVSMDCSIYGAVRGTSLGPAGIHLLGSAVTITASSTVGFSAHDRGTGATSDSVQIKGMNGVYSDFFVAITPASDPASGGVYFAVLRRA